MNRAFTPGSFECHVTTTVEHAQAGELLAQRLGWKTSEIKRDPLLGDKSHFYFTAHDKTYEGLYARMTILMAQMKEQSIPILRYKIEGIILDVRPKQPE